MKELLLNNWTFFRALRLLLGVMITVQGAMISDWMYAIAGLLFSLMALFNTGCCSVNTCASTPQKKSSDKPEEISYEEVK